jgi:hypothetical protein
MRHGVVCQSLQCNNPAGVPKRAGTMRMLPPHCRLMCKEVYYCLCVDTAQRAAYESDNRKYSM